MPSMQLAHTLFRLETALKDFYQLREMKVPESEEELRWSLNRFLAAAAKKHSPARIIIIIDGINKLKAEGAPDGALHWLPTELPPCVRFLVSSVEFERAPSKDMGDLPQHRTFVELARRQCPLLRIEPLSVPTRHNVIQSFVSLTADGSNMLQLNDSQQFKIVTAPATSQPMYLRSLLQALRATATLTAIPMDQLLETFLSCNTAHELIEKQLNICCEEISGPQSAGGPKYAEILGKMFSMVHISRNGLKYDEIWDMVKMFSQHHPPDEGMKDKLFSILFSFTMVVKVRPFVLPRLEMLKLPARISHTSVPTPAPRCVRPGQPLVLARDLPRGGVHEVHRDPGAAHPLALPHGQVLRPAAAVRPQAGSAAVPPGDGRVVVEGAREAPLAGSFYLLYPLRSPLSPFRAPLRSPLAALRSSSHRTTAFQVKNCLTDIEMFDLWWTPKFKSDFIKFWASLTRQTPTAKVGLGLTYTAADA